MTVEEEKDADTLYCPECGTAVVDGICPKCGASVGLEAYGYRVKQAQNKGFILTQSDDSPVLTFGALGSRTVAAREYDLHAVFLAVMASFEVVSSDQRSTV